MQHIWIGMDAGGAFTDRVLAELTTGTYHAHQLPVITTDLAVGRYPVPCAPHSIPPRRPPTGFGEGGRVFRTGRADTQLHRSAHQVPCR